MSNIIRIEGTDIISKSANIINNNFAYLDGKTNAEIETINNRLGQIASDLNALENKSNQNYAGIITSLDSLTDKIDNDFDETNIQQMIDNSIANSNRELGEFIKNQAGEQVSKAMSGYAKRSNLEELEDSLKKYLTQNDLEGYLKEGDINTILEDYVTSAAFTEYKSDANTNFASATTIVANSKFYYELDTDTNKYYLVTTGGERTTFEGIGDFYLKGKTKKTTDGTEKTVKEVVDPDNKGVNDITVLAALIKLCEQTFKTISTELSTIRQEVGNGEAKVDILAAVQGKDGKNIAASIFAYANQEGSRLALNADNIILDAEHKLKLKAGTFEVDSKEMSLTSSGKLTIDSDNLKLNNNELMMKGDIYATNQNNQITAGVIGSRKNTNLNNRVIRFFAGTNSGKEDDVYNTLVDDISKAPFRVYDDGHVVAKDIELVFNGNRTSIDEQGILHAYGADIDGDVTANKINVISKKNKWSVKQNDEKYSGDVEIETNISADNFKISASGVLYNEDDDSNSIEIDKTKNYLELTVLPYAHNESNNGLGNDLYGVPTLTMYYNGVPFVLNPATWVKRSSVTQGGVNLSNMRWKKVYNTYNYAAFNNNSLNNYHREYYDQKLGYHWLTPYNAVTDINPKSDELCQLTILDWGEEETTRSLLLENNLINNHDDGVFIKKSSLYDSVNNEWIGYGISSHSITQINGDNCAKFKSLLPTSNYKVGPECQFHYNSDWVKDSSKDTIRTDTKFGINAICTLIHEMAQSQTHPESDEKSCWNNGGDAFYYIPTYDTDGVDYFLDILPFTSKNISSNNDRFGGSGNAGQMLDISIKYYPLIEINSNGTISGINSDDNTIRVKNIYGKCSIQMVGENYNDTKLYYAPYNRNEYGAYTRGSVVGPSKVSSVEFKLDFDFYLMLNEEQKFKYLFETSKVFTGDNANDSELENTILKVVIEKFLQKLDFSRISSSQVDFYGKISTEDITCIKKGWNSEI